MQETQDHNHNSVLGHSAPEQEVIPLKTWVANSVHPVASPEVALRCRVVRLFIERVQATGQCDYPELVELMEATYEVDQSAGRLLLPRQVDALCLKLEGLHEDISNVAMQLRDGLDQLSIILNKPAFDLLSVRPLISQMGKSQEQLDRSVQALLGLADEHGVKSAQKSGWRLNADDQGTTGELRYLCQSLGYCHRYLVEYLQFPSLRRELAPGDAWLTFAKRLYRYLDECVSVSGQLSQLLQQAVQLRGSQVKAAE
ncbi:MAG: hypothetical protein MH252_05830 [Thermosynechococcaceae cyanobacterium MS004]|nr:hypothetical protein [Thermosynechococcaceae cyanobacterium MS004]